MNYFHSDGKGRRERWPAVRMVAAMMAVALAAAGLASCGKPEKKQKKTFPVMAVAAQAQGETDVSLAGSDCWLSVGPGMSLFDGDTAWTGGGSSLFLMYVDGPEVAVGENASFRLVARESGASRIELSRGEVWLEGPGGDFPTLGTPAAAVASDIQTSSVSLGVKVEPGGATTVMVASGSAKVENGAGKATVMAGNKSTCKPGTAPEMPVAMGSEGTTGAATGLPYFVNLQLDPFFRNKATRDAAEDDARDKISVAPTEPWPFLNLGRALLDAGNNTEARAQFEQALALDPQFAQAYAGLGKIDLIEGKWKEAADAYASARRADPQSMEAVFGLAQAALGSGNLREAEKWYKENLKLESDATGPLVGLAIVDLLRMDLDTAKDNLDRAARADPANTRAHTVMAIVLSLRKDLDGTRGQLKKALGVDPNDFRAYDSLGAVAMRLGLMDEASEAYQRLVDSGDPRTESEGYQNLGVVKQTGGDIRGALKDWVKAHDLAGDRVPVLIDMGQADLALGHNDASVTALTQAVSLDPDNWYTHEWLSRAYFTSGAYQAAASESAAALMLNPSAWISHLVLGLSLTATGDSAGAALELDRGRGLKPQGKLSASENELLKKSATSGSGHFDAF